MILQSGRILTASLLDRYITICRDRRREKLTCKTCPIKKDCKELKPKYNVLHLDELALNTEVIRWTSAIK